MSYLTHSYVHRLIASGGDGKLVELPGADEVPDGERRTYTSEEKVRGRHLCDPGAETETLMAGNSCWRLSTLSWKRWRSSLARC